METDPHRPRPNVIYPWLRVVLWILPVGFFVISLFGIFALAEMVRFSKAMVITTSMVLNVLFLIGAGWCDYNLSLPARKSYRTASIAVLQFILSQVFIVPILLGAAVIVIRIIYPDLT